MVFQGRVENGTVILDQPANLPNGTRVKIEPLTEDLPTAPPETRGSLSKQLLDLAGRASGLPADAAQRHDEYLTQPESR